VTKACGDLPENLTF